MTKIEQLSKAANGETIIARGRHHLVTMNETADIYTLWSYAWFDEEPYVWSPRTYHLGDYQPMHGAFEAVAIALSDHEDRASEPDRSNV